jgi:voltage-gated potassium channel Kch
MPDPSHQNVIMPANSHSWKMPLRLGWLWADDRGMSFFLAILVVVVFVVLPLAGIGLVGRLLVDVAFSLMLISGALATNRNVVLTWIIITLTVGGLVVHWVGMSTLSFRHPVLDAVLIMLLFGCFVVVLMLQVFRAGQITLHRILGAVAAYLSVGIAWGFAYLAASLCNPDAVHFSRRLDPREIPAARYIYFSFVTLTTLGYGDAVPGDPLARTLAVAEALTGQLYPAVLIAGVLGMALQSRNGTKS